MKANKLTLMLAVLACAFANADSPPVAPTPAELIKKSIDAVGGKEKLDSVRSSSITAEISVAAQNMSGTLEMLHKGEKAVIEMNLAGVGNVKYGIDGDIAYELTDIMGARLLEDAEKRQLTQGLDPQSQFDRLTTLTGATVTGPEKIGDASAWKLSGKNEAGDEESHWMDTTTFQTIRSTIPVASPMGKLNATVDFSDFKSFDGMLMPMTMKQSVGPMTMKMTIKDVKLNPDIPDVRFAVPEEVRLLAEKKAAASQPATQPGATVEENKP